MFCPLFDFRFRQLSLFIFRLRPLEVNAAKFRTNKHNDIVFDIVNTAEATCCDICSTSSPCLKSHSIWALTTCTTWTDRTSHPLMSINVCFRYSSYSVWQENLSSCSIFTETASGPNFYFHFHLQTSKIHFYPFQRALDSGAKLIRSVIRLKTDLLRAVAIYCGRTCPSPPLLMGIGHSEWQMGHSGGSARCTLPEAFQLRLHHLLCI